MSPQSPSEVILPKKNSGGMGPIAGIVIIILLLAAGGYYFFMQTRESASLQSIDESDPQTEALKETSSSDEAAAIESDLEATSMGDIESDLSSIEGEF